MARQAIPNPSGNARKVTAITILLQQDPSIGLIKNYSDKERLARLTAMDTNVSKRLPVSQISIKGMATDNRLVSIRSRRNNIDRSLAQRFNFAQVFLGRCR